MSSDRATRRLVAIVLLGAGLVGGSAPLHAAAQEPAGAPDSSTTTTAPAPGPTPAPETPVPATPGPATPVPAQPAPAPAAPARPQGTFTPPVSGPLDFLNNPVQALDLPPEPEQRRPPAPKRKTTPRREESAPADEATSDEAPAGADAGTGEGADGNPLDPSTFPAEIPNFFIGRFRIPPFLLSIYQAAGIQYGVPWEVLAAINEIETDYGRNLNVSSAGALGWMQFMPSSWAAYGVDANEDGRKDPFNPVDAIFAAARYLKAAGAATDLSRAIFAYNHADWYVDSVLQRARLVAGLPSDLVGSLTGLAQGRAPVAARVRYTKRAPGAAPRSGLRILATPGSPAVAVQDGQIVRAGYSARLGHFVMLRDAYGNTYTYGHLASVARSVLVAKEQALAPASPVDEPLRTPLPDPAPTEPATAGSNEQAAPAGTPPAAPAPAASATVGPPTPGSETLGPPTPTTDAITAAAATPATAKERLFANPSRPRSLSSGGRQQILDATFALPAAASLRSYFAGDVGLERKDFALKRLYPGRRVIAGTILGRIGRTTMPGSPHMLFEIRPPGIDIPRIDPEPFIEGWRLLESTAIYRAKGPAALAGGSIGQILLMSKQTLTRRVLVDPGIQVYACGRREIEAGVIDRRVLATLAFLSAGGLRPTVSSLQCGHSTHTDSGNVSQHASGNAVDISKINRLLIEGNQGPGSLTDTTIRRLLTLQGTMAPDQIISLMAYPGVANTLALPDHADHIHIGFRPLEGAGSGRGVVALGLRPKQWLRLVDRLNRIDNPTVQTRPSPYAIRAGRLGPTLRPPP